MAMEKGFGEVAGRVAGSTGLGRVARYPLTAGWESLWD